MRTLIDTLAIIGAIFGTSFICGTLFRLLGVA